ncbi:MAG: hypothetical protein NTW04_05460, partial [Elusimicrobia bacterium]|nr:hypothetical protein [Elusimicrobiota bacterium]
RYPSSNMMPFVEQAYIKANRLFDRNVSLWAGKQAFTLGSGLALSDDGLGLTGIRLAINQIWKDINWQMFTYQPKSAMPGQGGIDLLGTYLEIPLEGIWSLYTLWEIDKRGDVVASQPVNGASRQFSGISYGLTYGSFIFDGEAAIEKGRAKAVGKNINFNGSAFLISGRWTHDTAKFGQIAGRVAFGRASGDKESTKGADEAFFPSFGHRYSGLERSGFGEIFGASLYDAQGGNPLSKNGLPTGVSGVQVYKMGATLSVFKTFPLYFSADFYSFESSVSPSGKKLGNEWDFGLSYPASEQFNISLIYAAFTPGNGYSSDAKSPKKISFQASAKF